jgi:hypothetical protein
MPFASNNNAVLIDGCDNLENLSVLLEVTEDVATTDGGGWSFQLNCYPPGGEYCQTSPVTWMQYIVYVQGGNLSYEVQYWATGQSTWPTGYTPQPGTAPWLPCWANDYYLSAPFATISGDTLPRESTLQIALTTDGSGGVTQVDFTYTDPDDNAHPASFTVPAQAVHPIVACELNLVGPGGGSGATFTQGLTNSRGIIYYSISTGQLSVQTGGAGSACGEAGVITAETSNMSYSDISGAPGSTVTQILQQPIDCSIDSLFARDPAPLGAMRRLRDGEISPHPAGRWLIDTLDRHAADLAVLVANGDGDIAQDARDLLGEATRIAGEGRVFDAGTLDRALELLRRAAGRLPASMHEVAPAGQTLLESLRGRTLEEGLRRASTTIRPRAAAAQRPREPCAERLARRVSELEERISALEAREAASSRRPPRRGPAADR